jgi:alpha-D-xyloside xylohydrolase
MSRFSIENGILFWRLKNETVALQAWGGNGVRVRATVNPQIAEQAWALLPPKPVAPRIEVGEDEAVLTNGNIQARISKVGGLRFLKTVSGEPLLEEDEPKQQRPVRVYTARGSDLHTLEVHFRSYDGERLYGLGQHRHGRLDQKGCVVDLLHCNSEVSIPFLVSTRGYGFLWHSPAIGRVELAHNATRWTSDAAKQIDYWITAADSFAEIMADYADATGHAPMLPPWAAGFWQCKLRYHTQEEVLSVARRHKERGLPLSVIVVDFFHWPRMGDWDWNHDLWPDPAAMVRELREMGVELMVSVWPAVNPNSRHAAEMVERGLLVQTERGVPVIFSIRDSESPDRIYMHYYDPTHPEARRFLWDKLRENYYQHGVRVFWLDACEPEIYPRHYDNLRFHAGPGLEVTNLYPLLHERGLYDGLQAEGEKEIITLCRAAWAGSQRYGAAVWSGDIPSTFESLAQQVRAGLNMGLSGIPWWTTDIGGFIGGDIRTPYFRELIVRWFQYGVFCPLFRLHGVRAPMGQFSGADNEVWSFGEEAYAIIKGILFLRERLRPYIMEQMRAAHLKGTPPMRPLFFDFSQDEQCFAVEDEFMFGPDILVAPVVKQGARSREVYLPAGTAWIDAFTGDKLEGGQRLVADAPIERIPVYLRDGCSLPVYQR